MLLFYSCRTIMSSISLLNICPCNFLKKASTSPIILPREQRISITSTSLLPQLATQSSLVVAMENNPRKLTFNESSPHHLSFQNLTLLPFSHPKLDPFIALLHIHPSIFYNTQGWKYQFLQIYWQLDSMDISGYIGKYHWIFWHKNINHKN